MVHSGAAHSTASDTAGTAEAELASTDVAGVFTVNDAIDVAEQLMAADDLTASTAGNVEPDSPEAARIAVEHLDRRLRELPSIVRRGLAGAERNADRLSDDRLQGLAELIQNADDVAATTVAFALESVRPTTTSDVETDSDDQARCLVAVHDGSPLRLRDVVAMGIPWLSMKSDDASKVGEFGIGLMTLRSLSDTLDVHCGHFHLRLSAGQMTYLTDTDRYPADPSVTTFHVPVDSGLVEIGDVETWLSNWGDAGLLFLSHVRSVVLTGPAPSGTGSPGTVSDGAPQPDQGRPVVRLRLAVERSTPTPVSDVPAPDDQSDEQAGHAAGAISRVVVTEHSGRQWAVYARLVVTPQVARRSEKPRRDTTPVAVAFPLTVSSDSRGSRWPVVAALAEPIAPSAGSEHILYDAASTDDAPEHFATGRASNSAERLVSPRVDGAIHVGLPVRAIGLPFRVGAAFEPLANRRDLFDGEWNRALIGEISELWSRASLDAFARSPADAWRTIPLREELEAGQPLIGSLNAALADHLLNAARTYLAETLTLPDDDGSPVRFDQMVVEHPDLSGVVGPSEAAELTGGLTLMPDSCRDGAGRWRAALEDFADIGAPGPRRLDVADAVQLLTSRSRAPALMAALTDAALRHELAPALEDLWCVATTDGACKPTSLDAPRVLTDSDADPIWHTLGLAAEVDPAYTGTKAWARISVWLAGAHRYAAAATSAQALRRLSDSGKEGRELPAVLTDTQAQALRAAVESLDEDARTSVGPGIGMAVRFQAVSYDTRGRRQEGTAHPCEAYLIDQQNGSWASAAGKTPGLRWLHRRYTEVLKSSIGRSTGVGALRLFRLLGAESAPRLVANPHAERKYQGQDWAVPITALSKTSQANLRALDADYLIGDTISPDLDAVLASIASDRVAADRRRRADAVLASLSRAWGRLPTEAQAAKGYYAWQRQGSVPASWLLATMTVAWLSNGLGARRVASQMSVRTPGTIAMLGNDRSMFLHTSHDQLSWREVLLALGVRGDPKASDLIAELRHLRDRTLSNDAELQRLSMAEAVEAASPIYEALAENVDPGTSPGVGDVAHRVLIAAFTGAPGLIATEHGWRRPKDVLSGPPIFGNLRTFVPSVSSGARLWRALDIRAPRAADAEQVIRELAKTKALASEHLLIEIEALRLLATTRSANAGSGFRPPTRHLDQLDLRKLPVWTGTVWQRDRPVLAVGDPRLAEVLAPHVPVWRPGAEIHQFEALVQPMRLTPVTPAEMVVLSDGSVYDDDSTTVFQAAVTILQADLALNDSPVERALTISWSELATYEVAICPTLRVRSDVKPLERVAPVPIHAWIAPADRTLYVTDAARAGLADHGGMAVAALFALINPRAVALPWLDAWTKAFNGKREEALVIAARKAQEEAERRSAESQRRLEELEWSRTQRNKSSGGAGKGGASAAGRGGKPMPPAPTASSPLPPRTLVDPDRLTLAEHAGTLLPGGPPAPQPGGPPKTPRPVPPRRPPDKPPTARRGPVSYTDHEKETVGMRLARHVLGGDDSEIVDIRAQRGVGADAVDSLNNFYELKVHGGPIPDQIRLTNVEVRKALSTHDYFLVLVGNVEDGAGAPEVRIINDPLAHLTPTDSGSITLSGTQSAQALQFVFTDLGEPAHNEDDGD